MNTVSIVFRVLTSFFPLENRPMDTLIQGCGWMKVSTVCLCRHLCAETIAPPGPPAPLPEADQYPERLGLAVMVDAPFLFHQSFKMLKPFLDAVTVKKVVFVSGV